MNQFMAESNRAEGVILTTTTATTVYTAIGGNTTEFLNAVLAANVTATDATLTIEWTDASAAATYALVTATTVPARGSVWLRPLGLPLSKDDAVKATAGTANALHVIALIGERGRGGYGE